MRALCFSGIRTIARTKTLPIYTSSAGYPQGYPPLTFLLCPPLETLKHHDFMRRLALLIIGVSIIIPIFWALIRPSRCRQLIDVPRPGM
jgi:hypothetical protein